MLRTSLLAFAAGFLAVLCFHQPTLGLLHGYGIVGAAPFNMSPVPPLGVPGWLSAGFWGGVWGVVMLGLFSWLKQDTGLWWKAMLFGGIALTAVALFIVFPLKGNSVPMADLPLRFGMGFVINASWGLGVMVFARVFSLR